MIGTVETLRDLEGAYALLARPSRWTQGAYARSKGRKDRVAFFHSAASCWCLAGAIRRAIGPTTFAAFDERESAAALALDFPSVGALARWNDTDGRTFAEVRARLRAGIRTLRANLPTAHPESYA